VWSRI